MTPQQAHDLLTQVTASLNMTRQQHVAVMQALEVLKPKHDLAAQGGPKLEEVKK